MNENPDTHTIHTELHRTLRLELQRTIASIERAMSSGGASSPAVNPNRDKPKLSLGAKLSDFTEAFSPDVSKGQISADSGSPAPRCLDHVHVRAGRIVADTGVQIGEGDIRDQVEVDAGSTPGLPGPIEPAAPLSVVISNGPGKSRLPDLPRAPATGPLPFTHIDGAVSPFPLSWVTPAGRKAALNRWCAVIAREVGKHFDTHSERSEAEAFARSHRLSIANAFERRLVRKDVVAELTRLYVESLSPLRSHPFPASPEGNPCSLRPDKT